MRRHRLIQSLNSIEQVYLLRTLALQLFCEQGWQHLIVETEIERARCIVAFVDVLKRAERLDKVLILSNQSKILEQIQRSFELHTSYSITNLCNVSNLVELSDVSLVSYEQFFELYGLTDLDKIFNQFQLIILNDADNERNRVFMRKLRTYQQWVMKVDVLKQESSFLV